MSHNDQLGKLIKPKAEALRDAIHIAIAPCVAAGRLSPGQEVGFANKDDYETVGIYPDPIGIVDPFLVQDVQEGQRFYVLLFPNTVTGMRHEWTHPAFAAAEKAKERGKAIVEERHKKMVSEKWLREFCDGADCPSYDLLMEAIQSEGNRMKGRGDDDYVTIEVRSDYIYVGGSDAHGDIPDEFWDHVEVVTGKKAKLRPTGFTCSC